MLFKPETSGLKEVRAVELLQVFQSLFSILIIWRSWHIYMWLQYLTYSCLIPDLACWYLIPAISKLIFGSHKSKLPSVFGKFDFCFIPKQLFNALEISRIKFSAFLGITSGQDTSVSQLGISTEEIICRHIHQFLSLGLVNCCWWFPCWGWSGLTWWCRSSSGSSWYHCHSHQHQNHHLYHHPHPHHPLSHIQRTESLNPLIS